MHRTESSRHGRLDSIVGAAALPALPAAVTLDARSTYTAPMTWLTERLIADAYQAGDLNLTVSVEGPERPIPER